MVSYELLVINRWGMLKYPGRGIHGSWKHGSWIKYHGPVERLSFSMMLVTNWDKPTSEISIRN